MPRELPYRKSQLRLFEINPILNHRRLGILPGLHSMRPGSPIPQRYMVCGKNKPILYSMDMRKVRRLIF